MTNTGSWNDVLRNLALIEEHQRYAAEHPRVCEIRCSWSVHLILITALPNVAREPRELAASLMAIPIIVDNTVPAGHVRMIYSDGSTKDTEVIRLSPECNVEASRTAAEAAERSTVRGRLSRFLRRWTRSSRS